MGALVWRRNNDAAGASEQSPASAVKSHSQKQAKIPRAHEHGTISGQQTGVCPPQTRPTHPQRHPSGQAQPSLHLRGPATAGLAHGATSSTPVVPGAGGAVAGEAPAMPTTHAAGGPTPPGAVPPPTETHPGELPGIQPNKRPRYDFNAVSTGSAHGPAARPLAFAGPATGPSSAPIPSAGALSPWPGQRTSQGHAGRAPHRAASSLAAAPPDFSSGTAAFSSFAPAAAAREEAAPAAAAVAAGAAGRGRQAPGTAADRPGRTGMRGAGGLPGAAAQGRGQGGPGRGRGRGRGSVSIAAAESAGAAAGGASGGGARSAAASSRPGLSSSEPATGSGPGSVSVPAAASAAEDPAARLVETEAALAALRRQLATKEAAVRAKQLDQAARQAAELARKAVQRAEAEQRRAQLSRGLAALAEAAAPEGGERRGEGGAVEGADADGGSRPAVPSVRLAGPEDVRRVLGATSDYEVLQVPVGSTCAEVRRAYRRLAASLHPDKCRQEGAAEAFIRATTAYNQLLRRSGG